MDNFIHAIWPHSLPICRITEDVHHHNVYGVENKRKIRFSDSSFHTVRDVTLKFGIYDYAKITVVTI